ncbi:hypothetical protein [Streptomyces sp. NPDC007088]|uniref:hypothetical protein n=1 Tax=Streptomyces sp. NPDC007088 TaxID=3364773 RepID=UPI0036C397E4
MSSITTAQAASRAHVTVATIRVWARNGVIAATKAAGRWSIDTASLARRITIGAMRARKATRIMAEPTGTIVSLPRGRYGVRGNAEALAAAYRDRAPVTPTNPPYAQDKVFLGLARQTYGDYGITPETLGLYDTTDDGDAVYYLDTNDLSQCPAFATAYWEAIAQTDQAAAAAQARDDDYLNPRYT